MSDTKPFVGAFPWPNAIAVSQYLLVKNNAGTSALCGATDTPLGVNTGRVFATDPIVSLEPLISGNIYKLSAAGAISAYASVWQAASGQINDVDSGEGRFGVALEAASGAGSIIKVMYLPEATASFLNTLAFDGATGANEIRVPTNLADALSVEDSAGDLIVITTTTGSQVITITPALTVTGACTANGGIVMGDAQNIALNTGTGSQIGTAAGQKLGFWGTTPATQPAHVTDPAATAQDLTDNTGGTPDAGGAIANLADGSTYANDHAALENNLATIAAEYNKLKDDVEANNAAIDSILAQLATIGLQAAS